MKSNKAGEQPARYAMYITDISDKTQYTKEVVRHKDSRQRQTARKGGAQNKGPPLGGNTRVFKSYTEGPIPKKAAQLPKGALPGLVWVIGVHDRLRDAG